MEELPKANSQQVEEIMSLSNKIFFGIVSCSAVQHMKVSHVHDLAKISAEIAVGAELQ